MKYLLNLNATSYLQELKLLKRTIEGLEAEQQNLKHQLRQRDHLIHVRYSNIFILPSLTRII